MWSKDYWKDLSERAFRTFAQALVGAMSAGAVTTLHQVDWPYALSAAGFAAAVSVLMSLGASQVGDRGTAALLPAGDPTPEAETPASGVNNDGGEGGSIARDGNAPR